MLREEIVTTEEQHDLDRLGIAKNAREEKIRARDAKLKQQQENERMMKLYREHVLQEQPGAGPGADRWYRGGAQAGPRGTRGSRQLRRLSFVQTVFPLPPVRHSGPAVLLRGTALPL